MTAAPRPPGGALACLCSSALVTGNGPASFRISASAPLRIPASPHHRVSPVQQLSPSAPARLYKVTTVGLRRPRSKIADTLPGKLGEPLLSETLRLAPPTSSTRASRTGTHYIMCVHDRWKTSVDVFLRPPRGTHFSPMRASCNVHFEQWRTSFQRVPTAIMFRIIAPTMITRVRGGRGPRMKNRGGHDHAQPSARSSGCRPGPRGRRSVRL